MGLAFIAIYRRILAPFCRRGGAWPDDDGGDRVMVCLLAFLPDYLLISLMH